MISVPMGGSIRELFEGWLIEHFVEKAVFARPLFLLLNGHSTHSSHRPYDIILLCLPLHTTHESQPLDVSVFAPFFSHLFSEA